MQQSSLELSVLPANSHPGRRASGEMGAQEADKEHAETLPGW